ncbi:sterol desaturase family protein [Caulobacter sp. 17J65-9]|uniref:sterol desaturase family protein n=1 Tax=Caulobacter sp. 17J65-9 TaxID=2709382 RepID=UPI0013CBA959|nr:sterol desaturase family protein [Caulobacter sp. 17J65-9]
MTNLLVFIASTAAIYALLRMVELARPAGRHGAWRLNVGIGLINHAATQFMLLTVGPATALLVNRLGGGLIDLGPLGLWGVALYVLAADLGEYLFHRAQHVVPFLWRLHSLHHSDTAMNVTTSSRHHWLDPLLKGVSIFAIVGLLFKVTPAALAAYGLICFWHHVVHANIRLGFGRWSWVLNAPQYHRMHHATASEYHDCNYSALFPVYDLVSGKYRRPEPGEFPETGLDDGRAPTTLIAAATWR